jgi:hypothetical protein
MIRWPKMLGSTVTPGSVRDELVSFIDLAPTVLALAGVEIPTHLQGRVLVGPRAAPPPEFVFAARDRMDIEYDMMRSARDGRFLYIRNFEPELPYAGHIIYRNQSAIMQEWFRLQAERKLTGPPELWMRTQRPAEELYDTKADPHQIHDLFSEPAHNARADAERRDGVDGARRRPGSGERARDETANVAGWRSAGDCSTLHRPATDDRCSDEARVAENRGADRVCDLRSHPGGLNRVYDRGGTDIEVAALHRTDPR